MKVLMLVVSFFVYELVFSQSYISYVTGDTSDVVTPTSFGLCLMGGATEEDHAMRWFLQKSGGGDIIVLRTTGTNGYNDYLYTQLGVTVNSVETILFNNATASFDPYVLRKIASAEAIFIAGGNQYTYVQYWRGTPVDSLLNYLSSVKKIPIGGTSAGMSILGWAYNSAQTGSVTSAQALANPFSPLVTVEQNNFLKFPCMSKTITDTHFDNPDRRGRQVVFLSRMLSGNGDSARGIACDEYTAVCIDSTGIAKVFGGYPQYDDNAYFIQVNRMVPNNPETFMTGQPLTWDRNHAAIKAYAIKGDTLGSKTFDVKSWLYGTGGSWQHWYVLNGVLYTTAGTPPDLPLPVTFVQVNVSTKQDVNYICWKVMNQQSIKQYEVERSIDGKNFTKVGSINAQRNGQYELVYSWLDKNMLAGDYYYRIKSLSFSGESNYSVIVKANNASRKGEIIITPNPIIHQNFTIHLVNQPKGLYNVSLVNNSGQILNSLSINNNQSTYSQKVKLESKMTPDIFQIIVKCPDGTIKTMPVIIKGE